MAVKGDLSTMPLPELLQWLGGNGKTGELEIERDKVCKRISFSRGSVVAASTTDPNEFLGHFLVSRGQISEESLGIALEQQEATGKPLGTTLVEMGVLTGDDLVRNLSAKAEETIFSLFEWDTAIFRYDETDQAAVPAFPICIRVEDILLRGMQRIDEVTRIREVFDDSGIVPARTDKLPPPEVFRNKMARRIYESINGERTVADILLNAHASQYVVTKFLYELHRTGLIKIKEVRKAAVEEVPGPEDFRFSFPEDEKPNDLTGEGRVPAAADQAASSSATPSPCIAERREDIEPAVEEAVPTLEQKLVEASGKMSAGDFDAALEILDDLYKKQPNNESLRRLTQEAEKAFMDKAYRHYLPSMKVLTLLREIDTLESEDLTPEEFFLLSRIDGTWNVRSIVHISPIREVEALRLLKKMVQRGVVGLMDEQEASQLG